MHSQQNTSPTPAAAPAQPNPNAHSVVASSASGTVSDEKNPEVKVTDNENLTELYHGYEPPPRRDRTETLGGVYPTSLEFHSEILKALAEGSIEKLTQYADDAVLDQLIKGSVDSIAGDLNKLLKQTSPVDLSAVKAYTARSKEHALICAVREVLEKAKKEAEEEAKKAGDPASLLAVVPASFPADHASLRQLFCDSHQTTRKEKVDGYKEEVADKLDPETYFRAEIKKSYINEVKSKLADILDILTKKLDSFQFISEQELADNSDSKNESKLGIKVKILEWLRSFAFHDACEEMQAFVGNIETEILQRTSALLQGKDAATQLRDITAHETALLKREFAGAIAEYEDFDPVPAPLRASLRKDYLPKLIRALFERSKVQQPGKYALKKLLFKITFQDETDEIAGRANRRKLLHIALQAQHRDLPQDEATRVALQVALIGLASIEDFFVTDSRNQTPLMLALNSEHRAIRQAVADKIMPYLEALSTFEDGERADFKPILEVDIHLQHFAKHLKGYYVEGLGPKLDKVDSDADGWRYAIRAYRFLFGSNVPERRTDFIELVTLCYGAQQKGEIDELIDRSRALSGSAPRGGLGGLVGRVSKRKSRLYDIGDPLVTEADTVVNENDEGRRAKDELLGLRGERSLQTYNSRRALESEHEKTKAKLEDAEEENRKLRDEIQRLKEEARKRENAGGRRRRPSQKFFLDDDADSGASSSDEGARPASPGARQG
jgi:hypothetical protein